MLNIGINIDESNLVVGRSCVVAQSGGGKSYGIAVICEELLKKKIGFTIIDPEGEYSSLKQKFDLLLISDSGDINFDVDFLKLSQKVLENNIPVIFNTDNKELISAWLTNLFNNCTTPYLVIIEEADKFVPQRGENLSIIHEIAKRGRKRGLGLLIASQRPALINKDVLSQCNYQFIGKLTLENDISSIRHFFSSSSELKKLPLLKPGYFYLIGFFEKPVLFKFRKRITKHKGAAPKFSYSKNIKKIIDQLIEPNACLPLIKKESAIKIFNKNCRRRYIFFGQKEIVQNMNLIYLPLLRVKVKKKVKKFFSKSLIKGFIYITPSLKAVDQEHSILFDLSPLKDLSQEEVSALIHILYMGHNTERSLMKYFNKNVIKSLLSKDLIKKQGWKKDQRVLVPTKNYEVPRVESLFSKEILLNTRINKSTNIDKEAICNIIKNLDSNVIIEDTQIIYYPFYKAELLLNENQRELFINGLTGKVGFVE